MFCAAALWGLWKLRNNLCFQGCLWKDVKFLIRHVVNQPVRLLVNDRKFTAGNSVFFSYQTSQQ